MDSFGQRAGNLMSIRRIAAATFSITMAFNKYKQLLNDGEYASAEVILSGLTFEQVTFLPSAVSHTIYDELWHTTGWQNIVVNSHDNKTLSNGLYAKWKKGNVYPKAQISSQQE